MKPQFVPLALLGSILISVGAATAQTGDGTEPCVTGHRFEPGPIANGHHRQPTPDEIEVRTQQLRVWSKASGGSCLAAPPGADSPDRVVELDPRSSQRMQ
jgi:hypothetical protein